MGIANIINNSTTTSGGEIIRELVNASDGAGLHLDGSAGNIHVASDPDLGTKATFEFIISADSASQTSYIFDYGTSGRTIFALNSGSLRFYSGGWSDFSVSTLDDLKVHHLCVTVDGTAAVLYDNGNQVATATLTSNLDTESAADLRIGSHHLASSNFFAGTIRRARFYNRTLSSAEVQTAYERADVPFADQYGSASNAITNGNFETNTSGWTSENTSTFQRNTTSPISGTGDLEWTGDGSGYPSAISNSFTLTAGKKYRIKFTYRVTGGTVYLKFGKTAGATSAAVAGISEVALTAASNTAYEATVTPTESTTAYIVFRGNNNTTPTMFVDLVDFVQTGCVADYDLAFANENQSRMVADRSTNNVDGEMSSTGVKQTQVIKQLNSTAMRVGGTSATAATPADGSIVASGQIKTLGGALATPSFAFEEEAGLGISRPTGNTLNFVTSSTERMRIGEQGHVLVGTTALDANVGAKKMQLEGSASTSVGPEMLLHNPGQGGGAASLLTFGGKASGTEGYTAAIKATNTGTLTIGTAHASGGFSEPSADLTINSTGTVSVTNATSTDIGTLSNATQLYLENSTANKPAGITFGASNASGGPSGTGTSSARVSALASGGVGVFDADLVFETRSGSTIAERMRIDSTGNVMLGSGTPASLVSGGDSPVLAIGGTDSGLVTDDKAGAISFITSDSSYTGTYSDGICGEITSVAETSTGAAYGLAFHTGTTTSSNRAERLRISSTGLASFSNGINLGNTASATATTLDGYEEGTFTVTNNGDTTGVLSMETGEYTRIGNCVFIRVVIRVGTTFSNNRIGGLPFGCVVDGGASSWSPIGIALTSAASNAPILVAAQNGVANLSFFKQANTLTAHLPSSTSEDYYRVTGCYYTTDAF